MRKDTFNCPFCKFLHDELFIEPLIGRSFACKECEGKVKVILKTGGWITLHKRNDRMKLFTRKRSQLNDFKYMHSVRKKYMLRVLRRHNDTLVDDFFKKGYHKIIIKTRIMFVQEVSMVGIGVVAILNFFKANNGIIHYRTIKSYANYYD